MGNILSRSFAWARKYKIYTVSAGGFFLVGLDQIGRVQSGISLMDGMFGPQWLPLLLASPWFKAFCLVAGIGCLLRIGTLARREEALAAKDWQDRKAQEVRSERLTTTLDLPLRVIKLQRDQSIVLRARAILPEIDRTLANYRRSLDLWDSSWPKQGGTTGLHHTLTHDANAVLAYLKQAGTLLRLSGFPSATIADPHLHHAAIPSDLRPQGRIRLEYNREQNLEFGRLHEANFSALRTDKQILMDRIVATERDLLQADADIATEAGH